MPEAKVNILHQLKSDMLLFGKVTMPGMFTQASPAFHKDICHLFHQKDIRLMNVIAPRNHAKSSIGACVFPLYHLFFDKGQKVVVLSSKTQGHAINLLQTIKDTLDYSLQLRSVFGYWGRHSAKMWTKDLVQLKDGSVIVCKGTGQQIRGLKFGNQRPTLIVLDDPEDENNTKTAESMEWNLRWLLQSVEPSLDAQKGRLLVIGTPQHERCLVETLKDMTDWRSLTYKAIINDDEEKVLWPEQMSYQQLISKKKSLADVNRTSVFYREYQCEIIGDEDQLFKEDYLQYWDGDFESLSEGSGILKMTYPEEKEIYVHTFCGVDPASSTKQTADFSVILTIGIDEDDNRYILPYYRKHAKPVDVGEAIIDNWKKYKPARTRIETVGYQEMLRDYVRRKCEELNIWISGMEIKNNPRTRKSARLESMQPHFYQKRVYLKKDMENLQGELLMYPRGKHDDLLDGLYYAMKGAYKPISSQIQQASSEEEQRRDLYSNWATL